MLAAYPALFAAGGVAAGMPVGSAKTSLGAMLQTQRGDYSWRSRITLAGDVRAVTQSHSRRKWPRVTIWQGAEDRTVAPGNAEALADQWSELHGYSEMPSIDDEIARGVRRRAWGRPNRPPSVELWTLANIGHGFPVNPSKPESGHAGAWVVNAGLCAAQLITTFWGLERPRA
jgi:poly(3-hydroxybutyrate) depolymerase